MPTYKHPCPYCDELIQRDVAACPFCGARDPFAPRRCASCRTPLDDPAWIACPRCGAPTGRAATGAAAAPSGIVAPSAPPGAPSAPPGATRQTEPDAGPGSVPRPAPAAPPTPAPVEPAADDARRSTPAPARACPGCGAALGAGARFCTVCGTLAD